MGCGLDWEFSSFRFEEYDSSYLAVFSFDCNSGFFDSEYVAALGMTPEDYSLEVLGVLVEEFDQNKSNLPAALSSNEKLFKFYPHNISSSKIQDQALEKYGQLALDDETPFKIPFNYEIKVTDYLDN